MIVANYMTKDLITIAKDTKIFDAVELMKKHDVHRLPVVEHGRLQGLITEGTIQEAMPSKATSLSVYEVNYLLNKTTVADVMIKAVDVLTIEPDALLEEAIYRMRHNSVGVLPVISEVGQLVGIITNNDIFDAFLEITGYNQNGTRVSIGIPQDHKGILAELAQLFAAANMNIVQIVVYRKTAEPIIVIQLASTEDQEIQELLKNAGFQVLSCVRTEEHPA